MSALSISFPIFFFLYFYSLFFSSFFFKRINLITQKKATLENQRMTFFPRREPILWYSKPKLSSNKAGYTAVRCIPLVMTLLTACLVGLPSSPPYLPPSAPSPSFHHPLTIPCPYPSAEVENTRFRVTENKAVYTALGAPKHLCKRVNEKA